MSSSTTHTFTTPEPSSPGPVLPTITQSPAAPEHPPPPSDPPPSTSPLGGVMSVSFSGLLTTGPDNQHVCLCQCVIFKFFVYGQGFKRRYFYGNCRWSILLYIYVINMWLNLHLTGSFWLSVAQPATSCAGSFHSWTNKMIPQRSLLSLLLCILFKITVHQNRYKLCPEWWNWTTGMSSKSW